MDQREPSDEQDEAESAYDLLQRGQALLERRHHAQAAIVLERADRLEPRKASILEALGRAYFNAGRHEQARLTFEALLELDPSAHYAHFALGQSLKKLGRRAEAGTHLRLAVALSPSTARCIATRSPGWADRSAGREHPVRPFDGRLEAVRPVQRGRPLVGRLHGQLHAPRAAPAQFGHAPAQQLAPETAAAPLRQDADQPDSAGDRRPPRGTARSG